ncbi:Pyrroline-5-carboxylate reductase [Thermogutta terrifontis]|uniref:Pyrroline-5-carboxylate reductase n=1 Tax=Thermogutta terrifontis TaxID=1331910 RepID=A0A286RFI5_9BACT|nr:pyrroline-5-carboxylate reductase [Thermogutta terrifontis]ASV74702.1 Pyrroline-5-carboxylate reductase [Thermogutta terrifontis]
MITKKIGFIGAGQMARALAEGLLHKGLLVPDQVLASDPSESARQKFHEATGAETTPNNLDVVRRQDVVILAVKPQQIPKVLEELRGRVAPEKLVISIAAGIALQQLEEGLGAHTRVIRVMPNTPALVGFAASAYALGKNAGPDDASLVQQLLEAIGIAVRVDEKLLDAVTALSGSGPAYVYLMIEVLTDAGVRHGLSRDVALTLAAQTVRGAAEMVMRTGQHPAVLKDQVTSPGGTTIAALAAMESQGFRGAVLAGVEAAWRRARELSQ